MKNNMLFVLKNKKIINICKRLGNIKHLELKIRKKKR